MSRLTGAVTLAVGAVLAVLGTFLPLYHQVHRYPGVEMAASQTSWGYSSEAAAPYGRDVLYGVPITAGAVLALLGAAFAARAWGRFLAVGGPMLTTGSVWLVGQVLHSYPADFSPAGDDSITITTRVDLGTHVLVAACAIALVGAVLVHVGRPPAPRPTGPVVHRVDDPDDVDTPPLGFPAQLADGPRPRAGDPA